MSYIYIQIERLPYFYKPKLVNITICVGSISMTIFLMVSPSFHLMKMEGQKKRVRKIIQVIDVLTSVNSLTLLGPGGLDFFKDQRGGGYLPPMNKFLSPHII